MKPAAFAAPKLLPAAQRRTIVIAGASGLIGSAFSERARQLGHTVRSLVRRAPSADSEFEWHPETGHIDAAALQGADVVLNLSGASISKMPWTRQYREVLTTSRLAATNTLVQAINDADAPPAILLSGSAVGIYGSSPSNTPLTESASGTGFLAQLCAQWEAAAANVRPETTLTLLRTSLVLSGSGGMLPVVARLTRLGAAGPLGNGKQHWPWISIDDYVAALLRLIAQPVSGPVNMASPTLTTAAEFMRTLAHVLHRPYALPAPAFALRLALGQAAENLLLANQPVSVDKLANAGFTAHDTDLEATLARLLGVAAETPAHES